MKKTKLSAAGTSFFGTTIEASVNELELVLGPADYVHNDGKDKVNFEWVRMTFDSQVFTVYDWKEYRVIGEFEQIEWHIGGHNQNATERAKRDIMMALEGIYES